MNTLEIIEYQEEYKNDFKKISYEWLEKYALLELEDERILNQPEETVLKNGGHIFFIHTAV